MEITFRRAYGERNVHVLSVGSQALLQLPVQEGFVKFGVDQPDYCLMVNRAAPWPKRVHMDSCGCRARRGLWGPCLISSS